MTDSVRGVAFVPDRRRGFVYSTEGVAPVLFTPTEGGVVPLSLPVQEVGPLCLSVSIKAACPLCLE